MTRRNVRRCFDTPGRMATSRRAFSLVEMVIVIGIIVLLVGLTVAVLTSLTRGSESRRTQDMLTLIDTAYQEWKNVSERDITYGIADQPQVGMTYEIDQDTAVGSPPGTGDDHEATDEVLSDLLANAQSKTILANIDSELLRTPTPAHPDEPNLQDAWETEVITVFPGRLWVSGFDPAVNKDIDGTIRTEFEVAFGVCQNRRIRFVSAGPDGRFGDVSAAEATPAKNDTKDNVYSYPLEAP